LATNTVFCGFKTVLATVDEDTETDFGTYTPLQVDVQPSLEQQEISPDFSNVASFADIEPLLTADAEAYLAKNGFVVVPSGDPELATLHGLYQDLQKKGRRAFVTTDAMLTSYHVLFDYSLRVAEMQKFSDSICELTRGMVEETNLLYQAETNEYLRGLLLKNLAYFSVPAKLLDPEYSPYAYVADLVEAELALIDAHQGKECSPIMGMYEDYSQYIPRGHYTRNETLSRYFKAMMWYGRLMFRLEPNSSTSCVQKYEYEETLQALQIIKVLINLETDGSTGVDLYDGIYNPTVFYVGEADDLTVPEYLTLAIQVYGEQFASMTFAELRDEARLSAFTELAKELRDPLINSSFVMDSDDFEDTTKGFRFMGQRFIPDSYVFQQLVHKNVWGRFMPKGLDVMAALGSARAYRILDFDYQETRYPDYFERMQNVRTWFMTLPDESWVQNLYWNWLYSLMPLTATKGEGFPSFMTNNAWTDKELATALGSWTELRHDTILYAKQSYSYETGEPDPIAGYVEPSPLVYSRLASLCEMSISGLSRFDLLLPDYETRFTSLRDTLLELKTISEKELVGERLTESEHLTVSFIGNRLSDIVSFPPDDPASLNDEDSRMAVVADVHTDANSSRVLEEATGHPHFIYVIAPTDDGLAACVGGVYSYYEFPWPMSDRLTDGSWQEMLEAGSNPEQPQWMSSFISEGVSEAQTPGESIITVSSNDLIVADGDSLSISISLSVNDALQEDHAYLAALDPSGNLLYYPSFSNTPQPIDISMPAGELLKDFAVFELEVGPWLARGEYTWFAAVLDGESGEIEASTSVSSLLIR